MTGMFDFVHPDTRPLILDPITGLALSGGG